MIRFYSFIFLLLISTTLASAQGKFTFSGTVKDASNGEQLIGAIVKVEGNTSIGAATNEYGFFSLTLPAGEYIFLVSSLGFGEKKVSVVLDKNIKLDVALLAAGRQLAEVTVTTTAKNDNVTRAQMGAERINIKDVANLPVIFGEKDILKTVQLLPGVKTAGEGSSGYFVRGGAADQNLILLDEAIVYNPSHLLGFFSTFNSDAIKDVTLYKGNMPAQYGGRLSSVMDVKMNDGNNQEFGAAGSLGLISSKLNVEGPIVKDKGSFLVSGRRTYADLFLKASKDTSIRNNKLYFYDLNGKANFKVSDKDRVYLSVYHGKDKLGLSDLFGLDWGNTTATLRWNRLINSRWFSNTSLIYSNYSYNISINAFGLDASIFSQIRDWNLKQEFSYFPNPKNSVKIGFSSIYHTIIPGEYRGNVSVPSQPLNYSWENAVYANNSWKAGEKLNVDYGLRISSFSALGGDNKFYNLDGNYRITDTMLYARGAFAKTYFTPEPRISASYLLNTTSSVKAAYSRNAQYLHLISNSSASNPTDKWVPTNNVIKPEIADQVSVGYFRNFKDNMFEFSVETYFKYMQNQVDYRDGADVLSNNALEPELRFGIGRAYGAEFLIRKKTGRFTGWIGYTLSRTEKKIDEVNKNDWYVARQDRTHDLSVVAMYQLNKKWTVSGIFVYYTGNAVSFPSGKYKVDDQVVFYYTERNGYRMPAYHRLDLSATCKLTDRKRFKSELSLGVYNAYGRQNAYAITFREAENDPTRTEAVQTALFRFVPSISYNFKF
jgi:hypothetical protein